MQVQSPYEFLGSTLCVRAPFLYQETNIITYKNYGVLRDRGNLKVLKQGKGLGNYALVEFESMRPDIKAKVEQFEKPESISFNWLKQYIKSDNNAISYFANYKKPDGRGLSLQKQKIYCTNAIILNAAKEFERKNISRYKKGVIWDTISQSINELEDYDFKLPNNPRVLKRVYDNYIANSYQSLVHGGEGNDNSRVVTAQLENLILTIYCMKNNPFSKMVHQIYLQFLAGTIDIVNRETGELYNPQDFYKDGSPIIISEATVWNYINDPKNRALIDKYRSDAHQYNNTHRPHVHRHAPNFSLSKISLDDRDLPRKMLDGKRVKAYYAYDVASTCLIGASYSKDKDTKLFLDCIRDMLQFLQKNDYGIPMELEVEHHLVNNFKDDLMKAGTAFPFVRWCNAGNSQEKRAEHLIKAKKYGFEKRYQDGIGRWYAKSEAHRVNVTKIFDGENNNYVEKRHQFEALVADDLETVKLYNNSLHPNQKKYKGMSRLDVLKHHLNPNLAKFDDVIWARYVGSKTETTIRRSQYVTVQYAKYQLPSPQVLDLLAPNNYSVDAYYLADKTGDITSVFLYQNDQFICECEKIVTFNEALAEQTSEDRRQFGLQQGYIKKTDAYFKEERQKKISKIELIETNYPQLPPPEPEQKILQKEVIDTDFVLNDYDPDYYIELAKKEI